MSVVANQSGGINILLVPLVLVSIFLVGAIGFGAWSYVSMQDYKNNSDKKVAAAVKVAEDKKSSEKDNEFLEKEKEPFREYKSASIFGDISFQYPKTWSGYVKQTDDSLDLVMSPSLVFAESRYALRVTVEGKEYDQVVKSNEGAVKSGKLKASAIRLTKVPTVLGTRFDGEIENGIKGSLVVLPLRDKSIMISTESEEFVGDLDKIILPSVAFNP